MTRQLVIARLPGAHAAGELLPLPRIAPVERVDPPARARRRARHQRLVDPLDRVRLERRAERVHRRVVLGHHQQARGVLVDPVDDPRAQLAADPAQVAGSARAARSPASPPRAPGAGCTTRPAGLSTTTSQRSSWTIVKAIASAAISVATTGGGSQTITSPACSLRDGTPAAPFTVTAACPICRASCERDTSAISLRQEDVQPLPGRRRRDDEPSRHLPRYQIFERTPPRDFSSMSTSARS